MALHLATRTTQFLVTESIEENGFARLVEESSGQPMHADLFVPDPTSRQALRLQPGDRVSGTPRGQRVEAPKLVEPAPPPEALLVSSAVLIRRLEAFGLDIGVSAHAIAASEWRRDRRQATEAYPLLANVLRPQLALLFDWRPEHPMDDRKLIARLVEVTRRHLPDLEVHEVRDEDGELQHFRVRPEQLPILLGEGDWEEPRGRYAPLIKFINKRLAESGVRERWMNTGANWLFVEPALAQMLTDAGLTLR